MKTLKQTEISRDFKNKKVQVVREFDASLEEVWRAWTESELLDLWWAPKPWKARTKYMDFREGGYWLYAMEGPEGEETWCREDYKTIVTPKFFTAVDGFCDENGVLTPDFPQMFWTNEFSQTDTGTRVDIEVRFDSEADLQKIVEMGFEEGFTAALGNLDELLVK
jgi:uncharacterized protein YndB with AHSA1/START domain